MSPFMSPSTSSIFNQKHDLSLTRTKCLKLLKYDHKTLIITVVGRADTVERKKTIGCLTLLQKCSVSTFCNCPMLIRMMWLLFQHLRYINVYLYGNRMSVHALTELLWGTNYNNHRYDKSQGIIVVMANEKAVTWKLDSLFIHQSPWPLQTYFLL